MALPITSPTPTPVIGSLEQRQSAYAPVETHEPIVEVLAGSAADPLRARGSGANDGFDSLLCATLKALKSDNPSVFTSLLESCTSMIDSSSTRRTKTIKERDVLAADADGDVEEVIQARSDADMPDKRDTDTNDIVEKRQGKIFDGSL